MRAVTAILVMLMVSSGCASIFSGTTQTVIISSTQNDAQIMVDGSPAGRGRAMQTLRRKDDHQLMATKAGCTDGQGVARGHFNAVTLVNLFTGPFFVIGFVVDAISGGMWTLDDQVVLYQDCRAPATPVAAAPVYVPVYVQPPVPAAAPAPVP